MLLRCVNWYHLCAESDVIDVELAVVTPAYAQFGESRVSSEYYIFLIRGFECGSELGDVDD